MHLSTCRMAITQLYGHCIGRSRKPSLWSGILLAFMEAVTPLSIGCSALTKNARRILSGLAGANDILSGLEGANDISRVPRDKYARQSDRHSIGTSA